MQTVVDAPNQNEPVAIIHALINAVQAISAFILRLLWSDEAVAIFGTSFFYPYITGTLFIVTIALQPAGVVKRCQCYCSGKLHYLARVIEVNGRRIYSKASYLINALRIQDCTFYARPTILGSARALVGTLFAMNF